jgi:GDA1/CD39 (nucleoside phosphatase) family
VLKNLRSAMALGLLFLLAACAGPPGGPTDSAARVACQIVFDAGSSGTRLYLYAKRGDTWTEHAGPKTLALADPVRQIRGKVHADIDDVTTQVVAQLDRIAQAGPPDSKGQPEWAAFDWAKQCRVTDAMVLATAGMRIAEHENALQSQALWSSLQSKLQARVGPGVRVAARTLTGFEEGLFAWLAVRDGRGDSRFGIAEMGGASAQVTFPCPDCDAADDAVRLVRVQGAPLQMYSYSFLGLGQDEAPKTLGQPASCAYGIGLTQPGWQRSDCASRIALAGPTGLRDPYNFGAGGERGTQRAIPTARAAVGGWVLTGAFNYLDASAVGQCCMSQGACFEAPSSCFRALYLDKYLDQLGIPPQSPRADVSWTKGAVLCAESQCLQQAAPPRCRWSAKGCL